MIIYILTIKSLYMYLFDCFVIVCVGLIPWKILTFSTAMAISTDSTVLPLCAVGLCLA